MRRIRLVALLLAIAPGLAIACRDLAPDKKVEYSKTVIVGWVSVAIIHDLDSLPAGSDDFAAFGTLIDGKRELHIIVTEVRKGKTLTKLNVNVDRCSGGYIDAGERVIAYQSADNSWTVSPLPMENAEK